MRVSLVIIPTDNEGICVLTGLLGTFIMPRLENMIGLERAGLWSIVFEVTCLAPAVFAFFVGTGTYGMSGETWNQVLLFGGIALSRVGLWSFDLCQVRYRPHLHRTALHRSLYFPAPTPHLPPTCAPPHANANVHSSNNYNNP